MLIWSRFGIVVPIVWVLMAFISLEMGIMNYVQKPFSSALVMLATGIACFFIGRAMNKNAKKVLTNENGESVLLDRSHSFFFVNVENWFFVSIVLALLMVLLN